MTLLAGGWGGIPRELQRLLSLIGYGSTGGVCGRSLTAVKILFTGRQTRSLYLVCDSVRASNGALKVKKKLRLNRTQPAIFSSCIEEK